MDPPRLYPYRRSRTYVPSLATLCLDNIADNITRYGLETFAGTPERIRELVWSHLKASGLNEDQHLFMWLLRLQTSSPAKLAPHRTCRVDWVEENELLIYLAQQKSPLNTLQMDPSPDYTLLTTISFVGSDALNDQSILALRHLSHLFLLFLIDCHKLTDVGIRSLSMSLELSEKVEDRRGCWRLRGLWLDGCRQISRGSAKALSKWPLLNVLCEQFLWRLCIIIH